jgi:hypothetical protein
MRLSLMRRASVAGVALLMGACGSGAERATPDRSIPPAGEASQGMADSLTTPIRIEHGATRDLTGDGVPERLSVRATGSQLDSLDIRLDIRDGKTNAPLYVAAWRSADYFKYESSGAKPDSAARERITRRNLARVLNDSAFVGPRMTLPNGKTETVDAEAVRYHLAELAWRRAHGIPDTAPTPREAEVQLGQQTMVSDSAKAHAAAIAAEVRGRPSFTYYQGGELTYTIAWSDREHAFVRIFSCC